MITGNKCPILSNDNPKCCLHKPIEIHPSAISQEYSKEILEQSEKIIKSVDKKDFPDGVIFSGTWIRYNGLPKQPGEFFIKHLLRKIFNIVSQFRWTRITWIKKKNFTESWQS